MTGIITVLLCMSSALLASLAGADHCFEKYLPQKGRCRKPIEDNFVDGVDCCRRGGKGWGTNFRGRNCISCRQIMEEQPEEDDDPWNPWSEWGECSKTCEEGYSRRERTCKDGHDCRGRGNSQQVIPCVMQDICPVNGEWSDWGLWSSCSVTCGFGRENRQRFCNNPPPQHGGRDCQGNKIQSRDCDMGNCPIDGNWGQWSEYTACSKTCGSDGTRRRIRECDQPPPMFGGKQCRGQSQQIQICELDPCPVHGSWSGWSPWSQCSATCDKGRTSRRRTCTNPEPQFGGRDCEGFAKQVKRCNAPRRCPVHGGWSEWSKWGPCSATPCTGEQGYRIRSHSCTNPVPKFGGRYCTGNIIDTDECVNNVGCPVDGQWSEWKPWGPCSHTCGRGSFQQRLRSCDNPPPQNGGRKCVGKPYQAKTCVNLPACPGGGDDIDVPYPDLDDSSGSGDGMDDGESGDDEEYSGESGSGE
ncbi:properdin-like [Ptychodera flava]|uniref:properdin-like n=1 Tax=Ptychodera flava TaxID=63121 RepID=UPI00396AA302